MGNVCGKPPGSGAQDSGSCLPCCPLSSNRSSVSEGPERDVIRFFMMGIGGAGKTTVVRQLKCLCREKPRRYKVFSNDWDQIPPEGIFSTEDMILLKRRIKANIVTAICNLIEQASAWELKLHTEASASRILEAREKAQLERIGATLDYEYSENIVEDLATVVNDSSIQGILQRLHEMDEFRIEDGTIHFMNEEAIRQAFSRNYVPSHQDIVHSRYPTEGQQDFRFGIRGLRLRIHDMGGQSEEIIRLPTYLQMWMENHEGDNKNFVLYVASLADFNLLMENGSYTAMERSLRTFDIVTKMPQVHDCALMIFFNKTDRFEEMCIEMLKTDEGRQRIIDYLRDGLSAATITRIIKGTATISQLRDAVERRYVQIAKRNRRDYSTKGIFVKYTKAVDSTMMSTIFDAIQSEMITLILNKEVLM